MKPKHIFYSLCLATLVFACSNEPLIESNESLLEANLKGIANAPSDSGMYVVRTEDFIGFFINDAKTNLSGIIGVDITGFCDGGEDWNNIIDFIEIGDFQFIDNPSEDFRIVALTKGEVYAYVYEGRWDFTIPYCEFLESTQLLGEGMVQVIRTDNDLLAFINSGNNKNAFSMRAHGTLLSPDNEKKQLSAFWQFLWDKDPNSTFEDYLVKVSLQLH